MQPIFARACLKCHGPDRQRGKLRLDERASAFAGGDSGEPAVRPGDVGASPLLERVTTSDAERRMPLKGEPLGGRDRAPQAMGCPGPRRWPEAPANSAPAPRDLGHRRGPAHWAFRPLLADEPPDLPRFARARTAIDSFLLAKLKPKGLAFSDEAGRRRADPGACLLTSRAAAVARGGRGVRARIESATPTSGWSTACWPRRITASAGDGTGSTSPATPTATATRATSTARVAYRYRDFVIRALNDDMPFDQFVRWQVAGDEYAPDDPVALAATGFCTAAPSQDTTPADTDENKAKIRYDELDNMLATAGSGLLGLTIGCARCHDHKFDPIPTRDYYRMLAAFTTRPRREAPLSKPHRNLDRWLEEQRRLFREDAMRGSA